MSKKPLSAEEVAQLRSSPYVVDVKGGRISFTPEFKHMAYERLIAGIPMRQIFEEHDIEPKVLGDARLWGFAQKLRRQAEREEGFADLREKNKRKPAKEPREQTLSARVERLEHELAYTRQEVEFLKKIRAADLEAQKQWESKRHPK